MLKTQAAQILKRILMIGPEKNLFQGRLADLKHARQSAKSNILLKVVLQILMDLTGKLLLHRIVLFQRKTLKKFIQTAGRNDSAVAAPVLLDRIQQTLAALFKLLPVPDRQAADVFQTQQTENLRTKCPVETEAIRLR